MLIAGNPPTGRDIQNPRSRNLLQLNKSTPPQNGTNYTNRVGVLLFGCSKFRERGFWISPPLGDFLRQYTHGIHEYRSSPDNVAAVDKSELS